MASEFNGGAQNSDEFAEDKKLDTFLHKEDLPQDGWKIVESDSEAKSAGEGVEIALLFDIDGGKQRVLYYDPDKVEFAEINGPRSEETKKMPDEGWTMMEEGIQRGDDGEYDLSKIVHRFIRLKTGEPIVWGGEHHERLDDEREMLKVLGKKELPARGWAKIEDSFAPEQLSEGVVALKLGIPGDSGPYLPLRTLYYDPERVEVVDQDTTGILPLELQQRQLDLVAQGYQLVESGYGDEFMELEHEEMTPDRLATIPSRTVYLREKRPPVQIEDIPSEGWFIRGREPGRQRFSPPGEGVMVERLFEAKALNDASDDDDSVLYYDPQKAEVQILRTEEVGVAATEKQRVQVRDMQEKGWKLLQSALINPNEPSKSAIVSRFVREKEAA